MKIVETHKDVVINERTFRIKKFDARTGSFMALKITGLLAPLFKTLDLSKFKDVKDASDVNLDTFNISGLMANLGNLSEKDFNYIQEKCLQICSEVMPAGLTPVLNANGTFGVIGMEEDTMSVLALTAHTLIFNVKGFFSGSPLQGLVAGILGSSQQG